MVFKIAALFVLAATTKTATTANTQWIYKSGPNKGYLCAMMEKDGTGYDFYIPAAAPESTQSKLQATAMLPVPWQHADTEKAAKDAIADYCPTN